MKTIKRPRKLMRVRNAQRVNGLRKQQAEMAPVMVMIMIKLGLRNLNPEDVLMRLRKHILMLTDNPFFPTTTPSIADLQTKADELKEAIDKVASRNYTYLTHRNTLVAEGLEMIRQLSYNIQFQSKGDEDMIVTSGFIGKASKTAPHIPDQVMFARAKALGGGKIKLQWKGSTNVNLYIIEQADDPQGDWLPKYKSTKASVVMTGLEPGKVYYFRVYAINSAGDGNPSAPVQQRSL